MFRIRKNSTYVGPTYKSRVLATAAIHKIAQSYRMKGYKVEWYRDFMFTATTINSTVHLKVVDLDNISG